MDKPIKQMTKSELVAELTWARQELGDMSDKYFSLRWTASDAADEMERRVIAVRRAL